MPSWTNSLCTRGKPCPECRVKRAALGCNDYLCTEVVLGRRRFLMHEGITCFYSRGWIDGDVSFVNMANDAFFIDHEGGAIAEALLFVEDAIVLDDSSFEIAE